MVDVQDQHTVDTMQASGTLLRHTLPWDSSPTNLQPPPIPTTTALPSTVGTTPSIIAQESTADTVQGPAAGATAQAASTAGNPAQGLEATAGSCAGIPAYTLPSHPGFVLLPALLPVAHQLQLMCDALTR